MATVLSIEGRLRKLEKARTLPAGVFYLLWGRNSEDLEQGLADAKAQGTVSRGHRIIRSLWTGSEDAPPPRWVPDTGLARDLTKAEDDGLYHELERRAADLIEEHGEDVEPYPAADQLTDVELFAIALGEWV